MSEMSGVSDSDYILSSSSDMNPSGCRWITIGHGDIDCTEEDFKVVLNYFTSQSPAGSMCLEQGTKSKHMHIHVACIMDTLPPQWKRDLFIRLKWGGKRQPKWLQHHPKRWTVTYTWQNIVGGYMTKDDGIKHTWGISPQYALAGKVAFTRALEAKRDKQDLTPFNVVRVLSAVGRQINAKTMREAVQACIEREWSFWKCKGRLHWDMIELDWKNKVLKQRPDIDEIMRSCTRYD